MKQKTKIRKNIDIEAEVFVRLSTLAAKEQLPLKVYIEKILRDISLSASL